MGLGLGLGLGLLLHHLGAHLLVERGARPSGRPARGGGGAKARTPSQEEPEEPKADIIIDYGGKPDALVRG